MDAEAIVKAIDEAYVAKKRDKVRTYIGASVIGNECDAYLAYSLRGFPDDAVPPKLKRIFELGHHIEDQVVADLKAAGIAVIERDPMTGQQWTYEGFEGHAICHTDGLIEDSDSEVAILEVKSMNENSFGKFKQGGVMFSHPGYYAQMQMMMGMSGIAQCFFIAYCKNTSEYHAEIVPFNLFFWSSQQHRIERIMTDTDVRRVSTDITSFRCRGCFKMTSCYGMRDPKVECRTCRFSVAGTNAGWWCELHQHDCDLPCPSYEKYEALPPR